MELFCWMNKLMNRRKEQSADLIHVTIIPEEKGPSNYSFHRKKIKYVANKGFPGCFIERGEETVHQF